MSKPKRILVVDDERDFADFVRDVAVDLGFDASSIYSEERFEECFTLGFDMLVLDLVMPGRDGIELLRFMAEQKCTCLIVLMSGYDSSVLHSAQKLASEHGLNVIASLNKPFVYEDFEAVLTGNLNWPEIVDEVLVKNKPLPTEKELLKAIETGQIEIYFQPQVNIAERSLAGVEALVRWNHPHLGLLMPNVIIPLAEQSGLMDELTTEVIEQSLKCLKFWESQGVSTQVSINIAAASIKELGFPEQVDEKIEEYQLKSEQVALEITETGLMQDLAKSLDVLTRLRLKMIKLSIDDFGTGYSSMVQLYRVPFSEMKIDRSFVMHASTDKEAKAIVEIIILLGHKLGMKVVSEGIEDAQTWQLLANMGCDVAQGFYIAKPLPAAKLLQWAKENRYFSPI